MSPLSMSQRAEPGPIYKVSWPEGSRLGAWKNVEKITQMIWFVVMGVGDGAILDAWVKN